MVTSSQNNDSEKVNIIIGKLIDKAEMHVRPVISAFDNSQSCAANTKRFDRFSLQILENCAEFLGISLADKDNFKIFTKKSLMDRLYCGFNALMPSRCAECSEDYVIDHEPDDAPFFTCYRCFKGSHSCERNKLLHQTLSAMNTPSGFVWLCDKCYSAVDPIESRKTRSRHTSGSDNRSGTLSSDSIGGDLSNITPSGTDVMSSTHNPQVQQIVSFSEDNLNPRGTERTCQKFLSWDCPHGISGKKKVNGKCCPHKHPRVCNQYRVSGFTGQKGCKKGKDCAFFHPDVCKVALERGSCLNKDCSKFHPFSSRKKKKEEPNRDRNQRPGKQATSKSNASSSSSDFLELRDLVTGMAAKLAALEKKMDQSAPSSVCHPPAQSAGQMFYPSPAAMMSLGVPRLPQHQTPFSLPSYF